MSFSVLPLGAARKQQSEGLPLKAVYRETVVGIRYLYSREDNMPVCLPEFDDVDFFNPCSFTGLSSFPDILSVRI